MTAHGKATEQLKKCFGGSVELTSKFGVDVVGREVRLCIKHPGRNMQTNENAFEAWALALHLAGYEIVHLDWDFDAEEEALSSKSSEANVTRHFNRFLYRVSRFSQDVRFNREGWFRPRCFDASHLDGVAPRLCFSHSGQQASVKEDCTSESFFEKALYFTESFWIEQNLEPECLVRQLPVGLFAGEEPSEAKALFPARASAIDLCGVDRAGTLKIYELKVAGNKTVGALSEVLCYAYLMQDLLDGRIAPPRFKERRLLRDSRLSWDDLRKAKRIECFLISTGELHPIVQGIEESKILASFPVTCHPTYPCA